MKFLLDEIKEIPDRARECYQRNRRIVLPRNVPYLGIGASYSAPLTLYYAGALIQPELSSEYYLYRPRHILPRGVLISQSGETSDTLANLKKFRNVVVITNNPHSTLGTWPRAEKVITLCAGEEAGLTATKTFVNTLLVLYLGLGIDPKTGIALLKKRMRKFKESAEEKADIIYHSLASRKISSLFLLGSGPNLGTARQGALMLSETTKRSWNSMTTAEYDHGHKETAMHSIVVFLEAKGKDKERQARIRRLLKTKTNALVLALQETTLPESLTPLALFTQTAFLAHYLAKKSGIAMTSHLGAKIIRTTEHMRKTI